MKKLFSPPSPTLMYSFTTLDGHTYRTDYTPEQILAVYSFKAIDEKNDPIHILSKQVNFQSFTESNNRKVNRHFATYLHAWLVLS